MSALTDLQKANHTFREVFGLHEEHLIQDYSCSLWYKKVYCPGTLYISQNYLCFQSKVLDQQPIISLKEVMELRKEKATFTNCLYVKSSARQGVEDGGPSSGGVVEHWFGMFIGWGKGDEAFLVAQELWKQHLNRAHQQLDLQLHTTRKSKYLASEYQSFQAAEQPVPGLPSSMAAACLGLSPAMVSTDGSLSLSGSGLAIGSSEEQEVGGGAVPGQVFGMKGCTGVTQRLVHVQRNHDFLLVFKLPRSEQLLEGYPAQCSYSRRDTSVQGNLFLSKNFLCFKTEPPPFETFLRFVIPLVEVVDIQRQTSTFNIFGNNSFKVTTTAHCSPKEFLFTLPQRDKYFNEVWQAWTWCIKKRGQDLIAEAELSAEVTKHCPAHARPHALSAPVECRTAGAEAGDVGGEGDLPPRDGGKTVKSCECANSTTSALGLRPRLPSSGADFRSERLSFRARPRKTTESIWKELLHSTKYFEPDYCKKQQKQEQIWQRYIALNGCGVTMLRTQDFPVICIRGIPDSLRGTMWMYSSGALFRSAIKPGYYKSLLDEHAGQSSQAMTEIEKDLDRSFPEHPFYQTQEGIDSLRNVLTAYSWRNPAIGYCQSMNIVAALLLLYTDEEDCFWLLSVIVEEICPKYYARAMVGSKMDQEIISSLMQQHMPAVHAHLEEVGFPTSILTQPWLLCLFIGFLPMQQVLRILDCLFAQGPSILIKVGLAMFKVVEKEILSFERMEEIFVLWKERKWSGHEVLQVAILDFGETVTNKKVTELRALAQFEAMQLVESNSKRTLLRELKDKTKFSEEELESFYHKCRSIFPADSQSNTLMDEVLFSKLFNVYAPFWRGKALFTRCAFRTWDRNNDGLVDMVDIAPGLSVALKGDYLERLMFCFETMDLDGDGFLTGEQLTVGTDAFISIFRCTQSGRGVVFQPEDQDEEMASFVTRCFLEWKSETKIVGEQPKLPPLPSQGRMSDEETPAEQEDFTSADNPAIPFEPLAKQLIETRLLEHTFQIPREQK